MRNVADIPGSTRGGVVGEAPTGHFHRARVLVAHAAERGDFNGFAERAGTPPAFDERLHFVIAKERGNLGEADDRIDAAFRTRSFSSAGERLELGIDLRGELGEEIQLVGAPRRAVGERVVANFLIEHDHILHQDCVQRPGVEEQHAALERPRAAALEARARAEIDVEACRDRRLEIQPQRRAPFGKLLDDPLEMARGEIARVHELQHQHAQVFLLDRRQPALGEHRDMLSLDLRRARHLEQRMQVRPLRRNPLLVAKEPDLGVEALMHDLSGDQLGQQRLPFVALRMIGNFARERLVTQKEPLREVEQRLPQLVFHPRRTVAVFEILRGQILAQGVGEAVDAENRFEPRGCSLRVAIGEPTKPHHDRAVYRQRIVRGK